MNCITGAHNFSELVKNVLCIGQNLLGYAQKVQVLLRNYEVYCPSPVSVHKTFSVGLIISC